MKSIEQMISDVLRREGGYVNHSADKGGPTKYGITQAALSAWRGRVVTVEEVKALTEQEARKIYQDIYFERPRIGSLPKEIQPQMFDIAVNSGRRKAAELLQRALNVAGFGPVAEDGVIGPMTSNTTIFACRSGAVKLCNALVDERIKFYNNRVRLEPSQKVFLKGWLKRAEEFREGA